MRPTAFVVGLLEKDTGKFLGCSVFSEEYPTLSGRLHPFTIVAGIGNSFSEGLTHLRRVLGTDEWRWVLVHMDDRGKEALGR